MKVEDGKQIVSQTKLKVSNPKPIKIKIDKGKIKLATIQLRPGI
jgi:hypothetical protein